MAELLHLPIADENEIISTPAAAPENLLVAANPAAAAAAAGAVTARSTQFSRPMMAGAGVAALLAIGAVAWLSGGEDDTPAVAQNSEASPAQKTLTEQPSAPQIAPSAPVEPQRRRRHRSRWHWCTSNCSRASRSASTASRSR